MQVPLNHERIEVDGKWIIIQLLAQTLIPWPNARAELSHG